jgi:hypothetical protein
MLQKVMAATTKASEVVAATKAIGDGIAAAVRSTAPGPVTAPVIHRPSPALQRSAPPPRPVPRPAAAESNGDDAAGPLPRGERAVLIAAAQYPDGVDREQLTVLTGYKRSSRDTYLQRLRERGFIDQIGDKLVALDSGMAALGDSFEPLPTGEALRDYWMARLPEGERRILEVLIQAYPAAVPRDSLDEPTGYKRSSRDTYIQRLSARKLVTQAGRGEVRASDMLFSE